MADVAATPLGQRKISSDSAEEQLPRLARRSWGDLQGGPRQGAACYGLLQTGLGLEEVVCAGPKQLGRSEALLSIVSRQS